MAQTSEIKRLETRRRELVAESDHLRQEIAGDLAGLRGPIAAADRGYSLVRQIQPFWAVATAATGLLSARKSKAGRLRTLGKIAAGWRLARSLVPLWKSFASKRGSQKEEPSTE